MKEIRDGGQILAIIHRNDDWSPGLQFCTPDETFLQAGCWQYSAGKKLANHVHKRNERMITRTQELTFVKRGSMLVRVYNAALSLVEEVTLEEGDFAIMLGGGHGYEILEDDTQILEVKNGPFVSPEVDKELF